MRALTYLVATTVDGFIARTDGSFDCFLQEGEHFDDLIASFPEMLPAPYRDAMGIDAPNRRFDAVLMGRATYEVGTAAGLTSPYPHMKQYVFSRTMEASPDRAVKLVSADAVATVKALKREGGKGIWLCGGATLAAALLPEIDELILKVNPILLGSGIPLFAGDVDLTNVDLVASKSYDNGFMLAHYRVRRT